MKQTTAKENEDQWEDTARLGQFIFLASVNWYLQV